MADEKKVPSRDEQLAARQAAGNPLQQAAAGGLDDIPNMMVFARRKPAEELKRMEDIQFKRRFDTDFTAITAVDKTDRIRVEDYAMAYYSFTPGEKQMLLANIEKLGGDVTKMKDQDVFKVWQEYVVQAAMYTAKGMEFNPWDVMGMDISSQEERRKSELTKPNETLTTTQRQVKLSTQEDAKAILYQASRTLLGRAPTEAESANFFQALNAKENENPEVTTTTTERSGAGDVLSQSSISTGGLSAAAKELMTLEEAKKNPEYGAYQAATTFKDALMAKVYGKGY